MSKFSNATKTGNVSIKRVILNFKIELSYRNQELHPPSGILRMRRDEVKNHRCRSSLSFIKKKTKKDKNDDPEHRSLIYELLP